MAESRSHSGMHRYDEEFVARVCHDAVRRFWLQLGGPAPRPWATLNRADREAAREAVRSARAGIPPDRSGTLHERDARQTAYQIVVALTAVAT